MSDADPPKAEPPTQEPDAPSVPERRSRLTTLLPALVMLAALLGMVKDSFALYHFPLDDAWIHQVYARSLAHGDGMAYNPGRQEAGSTSPLWALVTAPAHWLGPIPAVLGVKLVGSCLALAFILILARLAFHLTASRLTAATAATLAALEPRLAFSALSGMEPVLLVTLIVGAALAAVEGRFLLGLLCLGLMPVTRPEAVIFLPLAAPLWWLLLRRGAPWPRLGMAAALPFLPAAIWAAFCLWATGHPLPNSFYIKARPFHLGLDQMAGALEALTLSGLFPLWLFLLGLVAFSVTCAMRGVAGLKAWLLLFALPTAFMVGVVGSRTMYLGGYYWTRWLDPATLTLSAAAAVGLMDLPNRLARFWSKPLRLPLPSSWMALLVCLALALPHLRDAFEDRRDHLSSDSRVIALLNVRLGQWAAEHVPPDAVIGVNDAGALRYFSDRYCIDLLGLNNADVAFARMDTKQAVDQSDWLVIFPSWFERRELLGHIHEHFEPRAEARIPFEEFTLFDSPGQTVKVVFERRADPMEPAFDRGETQLSEPEN